MSGERAHEIDDAGLWLQTGAPSGKLLAVDVSPSRIGVAVCDPLQLAARPVSVIERTSRRRDFEQIADLARRNEANAVICGLPLNMDGSEGDRARTVRKWAMTARPRTARPARSTDPGHLLGRAALYIRGQRIRGVRQRICRRRCRSGRYHFAALSRQRHGSPPGRGPARVRRNRPARKEIAAGARRRYNCVNWHWNCVTIT